ncbi:MAG: FtsH protease activity modulator HflK [Alphaproteobacteria bacterium]|nr:FtsH protease activity modulator HflK [Alphaproteobacteria bacterium]
MTEKRKNPWGQNSGPNTGDGRPPSWGGRGGGAGGGQEPPDLDEMIRRAQENFRSVMPGDMGTNKIVAGVLLAFVALWLATGVYIVNPGENAVIQRFGAWSRTQAEPGLGYHLPVPIESRTTINVQEIRRMSVGYQEATGRGAAQDIPVESLMLTSDRNILDLDLEIQWNIKSAEDYLFRVQNQEEAIKQVAESAIREIVGQTNMFPIITNRRQDVANRAQAVLQKNLDDYNSGVNVTQVLIQKAEVHPDVQEAFQDVQSAKQDGEDVQNQADAYREDILPKARGSAIQMTQEAEGYRQSVIARAKGDAERFNAVYAAYLTGQDVTRERLYIETMESVLKNAQKIIMEGGGDSGVVPYLPLEPLSRAAPAKTGGISP